MVLLNIPEKVEWKKITIFHDNDGQKFQNDSEQLSRLISPAVNYLIDGE